MTSLHQETGQTIESQRQSLAEAIVARQYARAPERWAAYGQAGREKSVRDAAYHLSYLSEALAANDPSLFADYIAWAIILFEGLKLPDEMLENTLAITEEVLTEVLPPEMATLARRYLAAGQRQLASSPSTPSFIDSDNPLGGVAEAYLAALLNGQRQRANQLILNAVNQQGVSVKDIYLHIFQPSQQEIGRLWQTNQISVAEEHYCTAATQLIMSQLYPHIFSTEKIGRRLVASCVGGELHEIGIRMVADFFEMEGWDTYYLGANTPLESILQTITERQADVLAISATLTPHLKTTRELISQIRGSALGEQIKILVGGYPFNVSPDLWQQVQADASAPNAQEAISVANQLVEATQ